MNAMNVMSIKRGSISIKKGFLIINKDPKSFSDFHDEKYHENITIEFINRLKTTEIRVTATERERTSTSRLFSVWDWDNRWVDDEELKEKQKLIEETIEIKKSKPLRKFFGLIKTDITIHYIDRAIFILRKKTPVSFGTSQYKII